MNTSTHSCQQLDTHCVRQARHHHALEEALVTINEFTFGKREYWMVQEAFEEYKETLMHINSNLERMAQLFHEIKISAAENEFKP